MESRLRKRFYLLCVCLIFLFSCATKGDIEDLRVEMMMMMGQQVGAKFYPARGTYGGAAGDLDKITGTVDRDVGMVELHDDADLGDVTLIYILDVDSACGGDDAASPPKFFQAGDGGNECWELANLVALKSYAAAHAISDADGETLEVFEVMNGYVTATGAGTFNLPDIGTATGDAPVGSIVCFETVGDVNVSVNPDNSDTITLEGVTDGAGEQVNNPAANQDGTSICFIANTTTNWSAPTNPDTWVAGA